MQVGDKVRCKSGSIDKPDVGNGAVGYIYGFYRFSRYHPQEVAVYEKPEGEYPNNRIGHFWLRDVEPVTA